MTSIMQNSTLPGKAYDAEKIVQWYCCECGKAYGSIDNSPNGQISLPSRFDCNRCGHMMCPYCPKMRYGDCKH